MTVLVTSNSLFTDNGTIPHINMTLQVESYTNLVRWATEIHQRPAVRRGRKVNRASQSGVAERHDASDLDALEKP